MIKKQSYLTSAYILGIILSSTGYCSSVNFSHDEEGLRHRKSLKKYQDDNNYFGDPIPTPSKKLNSENLEAITKSRFEAVQKWSSRFEPKFNSYVYDLPPILKNYMLFCKTKGISCDLENFNSTLTAYAFMSTNREKFDKVAIDIFQIPKIELDKYYDYFSNKPEEEAQSLIHKAVEKGNLEAIYKMGVMKGIIQDFNSEIFWYEKAANRGHILAQYNLGIIYTKSQDAQDIKKGLHWFREAAEQGDQDAQFNIGTFYYNGFGVEKDLEQASYWLHKAAEQGETEAQFVLGQMFFQGQGVEQNVNKALEWLERAAQGKNRDACFHLGDLKLKVQLYPSLLPEEALIWYLRAAFLDHAEAMVKVGLMYYAGIGTPQESFPLVDNVYKDFITDDLKKWWKKASEEEKACFWWRRAADKGSTEAQFYLGWMYEKNYVSQRNDNENHQELARESYQKAAGQGDISAAIKLGQATPKDLTETDHESFQIWKGLAKNEEKKKLAGHVNFVNSIFFNLLGTHYEMGRSTSQNKEKAEKLYGIASELDNRYALPLLRLNNKRLDIFYAQDSLGLITGKINKYSEEKIIEVFKKVDNKEQQAFLEIAGKLIADYNIDV